MQVRDLIEEFALDILRDNGGLERPIRHPEVLVPSLELTGYLTDFLPERLLVFGLRERSYLRSLNTSICMLRLQNLLLYHVPALILTGGSADDLFPALEQTAAERGVPILAAPAGKSRFMVDLSRYLEVAFLPVKALPGTMMEVHGQGVLVLGESGIGKSESALELIRRGHRLVADDVVTFRREHNRRVVGFADSRIKYHMEIRGIGIIDVRALFGISAVMEEMPLDIVICLKPATDKAEFDRLGLIHLTHSIFDVEIPKLELPVRSGRNIAIQVEVAALNEHLKRQGHDSARLLMDRLFNNEEEKIGE